MILIADRPLRLTPEHGEPRCAVERVAQKVWAHRVTLYILFVTTLTLLVALFGRPPWLPGSP